MLSLLVGFKPTTQIMSQRSISARHVLKDQTYLYKHLRVKHNFAFRGDNLFDDVGFYKMFPRTSSIE